MAYNLIPIVVIILCVGAVIAIIVRHLSELAAIDVSSVPNTDADKIRRKIVMSRLKNLIRNKTGKIVKICLFLGNKSVQLSKNFRKKISRLEHYYESLYYHSVKLKKTETIGKVKDLTEDVKELVKNNQMDDAERKCLLAISLDPQNPDLYEMLTHIYWDKKDYDNAIGTISYLIELRKRLTAGKNNGTSNDEANHTTALLAAHYLELGLIYQDAHKSTNAIEAFQNALVLQPNHPRYLGLLLDASIESKNKEASIKNLEALRMVNPENEKIASYQALIDNIKNN